MTVRRLDANRLHHICTTRPVLFASKTLDLEVSDPQAHNPVAHLERWIVKCSRKASGPITRNEADAHHWGGSIEQGVWIQKTANGSLSKEGNNMFEHMQMGWSNESLVP